MQEDKHIEKFGILLEDVINSREKAKRKNNISFTSEYTCPKCSNRELEIFYASNSQECWEDLCGREGECIFCNKCMDIVEFNMTCIS